MFLVNQGSFNGSPILSQAHFLDNWKPSMKQEEYFLLSPPVLPVLATLGAYGQYEHFFSYSITSFLSGWWLGSYRDRPILEHGGNVFGHSSLAFVSPTDKIGIFIVMNQDGLGLPHLEIAWQALDLLWGYQPWL